MKNLLLILCFIGTFMLFFFLISAVGCLWFPYVDIITDAQWFIAYTMLLGWWIALAVTAEVGEKHLGMDF